MGDWTERRLDVDFGKNQAKISWGRGSGVRATSIHVQNLAFNQPGEQTESQTQAAVREAAKQALQELLDQL